MIIDKAKWHLNGVFPSEVSPFQAYVHTGLFLGWAISRNLASESLEEEFGDEIDQFRRQEISGPTLFEFMDGVLTSDELNELGNRFASTYYANTNQYFADYEHALGRGLPTLYHVSDTLENFRVISAVLDKRFAEWSTAPSISR